MVPFAGLLAALREIPDPRRRQGRRYGLAPLLLFSVLAVLAGATSYRRIRLSVGVHREPLNATFGARFRRAPAVDTLRALLHALDPAELEAAFRRHAEHLGGATTSPGRRVVALDGKTLRGSFDHLDDRAAVQVLSAFASEAALILAHQEIAGLQLPTSFVRGASSSRSCRTARPRARWHLGGSGRCRWPATRVPGSIARSRDAGSPTSGWADGCARCSPGWRARWGRASRSPARTGPIPRRPTASSPTTGSARARSSAATSARRATGPPAPVARSWCSTTPPSSPTGGGGPSGSARPAGSTAARTSRAGTASTRSAGS